MDIKKRIDDLNDNLNAALAKAAVRRTGRARIPGDGDGDGIPYEGRNKKPTASVMPNPGVKQMNGHPAFGQIKVGGSKFDYMQNDNGTVSVGARRFSSMKAALDGLTSAKAKEAEGAKKPAGSMTLQSAAKKPTFIDVLNNPEGRRMVEGIEDTIGSLRGKSGDRILRGILDQQVKELKQKFGFDYKYDLD